MRNLKIIIVTAMVFVLCFSVFKFWEASNNLVPMTSKNGIHTFVHTGMITQTSSGWYLYVQIVKLDDNVYQKFKSNGTPKEFMQIVTFMGSNAIHSISVADDEFSTGRKYPLLTEIDDPSVKELNFVKDYYKQHDDSGIKFSWVFIFVLWLMFCVGFYKMASKPTCQTKKEELLVTGRYAGGLALVVATPCYLLQNDWRAFVYSERIFSVLSHSVLGIIAGVILLVVLCWLFSLLSGSIRYFETEIEYRERLERERQALLSYMRLQGNVRRFGWPVLKIVTGTGAIFAGLNVFNAIMQGKPVDAFKAVSLALGIEDFSDLGDVMGGVSDGDINADKSLTEMADFATNVSEEETIIDTSTDTDARDVTTTSDTISSEFSILPTSFDFAPMNGMNTINTANGFEIQGADGHTLLTVDNKAGIVQDHFGNQIASIQGNRLVDMNTGDTIVWRDETTGVYRDGLSQILNTDNYGQGTFQSIKDVHGNGIDTINGELFDAKTHERIGSIHKV